MNKIRRQRLTALAASLLFLFIAGYFLLTSLSQYINLFIQPSDLLNTSFDQHQSLRLGGWVKPDSLTKSKDSLQVEFIMEDEQAQVRVVFNGILPDLFREGEAAVAEGHYIKPIFYAKSIQAKHDENYTPPELMTDNNPAN